jgi:hypothetical protein
MDEYKATDKAVNRISDQLQDKLDQEKKSLPVAVIKDGQACCPGCSQGAPIVEVAEGVKWVQLQVHCSACKTSFIVKEKQDA